MGDKIFLFFPYIEDSAFEKVESVIKSRWVGQGQIVSEFEDNIKEITNVPFSVAVSSGASAIRLALAVAGIGPGDEAITSAQACTATNLPILEQYALPVFADIHYSTGNINAEDIRKRITEKTKAILCYHWGGYPCDLEEIHSIARENNLVVIEDARDALGARYREKPIGSISPFTCFSFQAVQKITSGEGGLLGVLREKDFESARRRRWFGIDRTNRIPNKIGYYDFDIQETGFAYHMTNIAASIGLANLEEYDSLTKRRQDIAEKYMNSLKNIDGLSLFEAKKDRTSAHQLFTIHVSERENFCQAMFSRGIETSIVHMRNDIYSVFGGKRSDLPQLDRFSETHISIPLHNQLSDDQVGQIIHEIKKGW
jgi:perosamine synthetase